MNLCSTSPGRTSAAAPARRCVAIAGVATGVGFSIMMAALMEGSQDDFIRTLVDALPHISVTDERRSAARAACRSSLSSRRIPRPDAGGPPPRHQESAGHHRLARGLGSRRGNAVGQGEGRPALRRRDTVATSSASIRGAKPSVSESAQPDATGHAGTRSTARQMRSCSATGWREKIGARIDSNITLAAAEGAPIERPRGRPFHSGIQRTDETTGYVLLKAAQILEKQTGIVNEIRVRTRDPMEARLIARGSRANRLQIDLLAGSAGRSASALHDPQCDHVHDCRRNPAGRQLRYLQHHFHDHA